MYKIEFLKFPVTQIRRSIKDIDSSYRNPWDIYAELSQNAVDAIRKVTYGDDEKGEINIEIDAQNRNIIFEDNGCGISKDDLPGFLSLFSSGKDNDNLTVGEKGVGLKFVYFSSKYFEITSSDGITGAKAVIKDARLWKNATTDDLLTLDFEEQTNLPRGTRIVLKDIELYNDDDVDSISIFKLSFNQLKHVLRTKTYLGNTNSIWSPDFPEIIINLKYTDANGLVYQEVLKNSFALPTEIFPATDLIDIDYFEEWLKQQDRNDQNKRDKLKRKIITMKGEYMHNGYRKISYYACFFPSRRDWDRINENNELIPKDPEADYKSMYHYCLFGSGIFTAIKGMPTGISIENPSSGSAGYWQNFFMIFQDDALKFDIGRKAIHGKTQAIYQAKAKEIFNKFYKYVSKYISGEPVNVNYESTFDRYAIRQNVEKIVNLSSNKVSFVKLPSEQEAAVSAIFFELIGNGTIDDIKPIYLGYQQRYDLYAYYVPASGSPQFKFMEFKSHLRHLAKDFSEARKVFDEMDYVICWDVNDKDIQELSDFGIGCEEVVFGTLYSPDCAKSVTHRLTIPNCNPVYVIDLKKLM